MTQKIIDNKNKLYINMDITSKRLDKKQIIIFIIGFDL